MEASAVISSTINSDRFCYTLLGRAWSLLSEEDILYSFFKCSASTEPLVLHPCIYYLVGNIKSVLQIYDYNWGKYYKKGGDAKKVCNLVLRYVPGAKKVCNLPGI